MSGTRARDWDRQRRAWANLKGLRAVPVDLERVALLRGAPMEVLADPAQLAALIVELGLNDENLHEMPAHLHSRCGTGLRIWQYPNQFSQYLAMLSQLRVRSYLEIGIRHGGSFIATTEYLERFHPLQFAIGVDIIPCESMASYEAMNPKARFWCLNTRDDELARRLDELGGVDLVFVDSHHELEQCRAELAMLSTRAQVIAFHDITNKGCPDIAIVWNELERTGDYECFELVEQYPGLGPYMGIGLAVKKQRLAEVRA